MMTDGRKTPNGRTLFQDKVAAVLAEAIALGANAVEICVRDMRSDLRRRVDRDWYSIGEACSYPQVSFGVARRAPSTRSARREKPRHMTVVPGGASEARSR